MPRAKTKPKASPESAAELLQKLLAKDKRLQVPQLADLAAAFVVEMGGPAALAASLYKDYVEAPEGSQMRVKIMELVLKGLAQGNVEQAADVEDLTDDDLRRYLGGLVDEWRETTGGATPRHPGGPAAQDPEGREADPEGGGPAPDGEGVRDPGPGAGGPA